MIFKSKEMVISVIILISVIIGLLKLLPRKSFLNRAQVKKCKWEYSMVKENFNGIVKKIYRDNYNHNMPTLIIKQGRIETKMILQNELSGFYNYVKLEDSLYKDSGNLNVAIFREDTTINRVLNYGCDK